ncbi:hypothetical protein AB6N24_01200 [Cellulomonas sp. 179-A 4D5 NHS]|uniref:hypothetical protein n=1 Tax=Cellulomonas sp. 179-A 4D5 NHS TaxID=3142378 RepID=UPI0039A07F05
MMFDGPMEYLLIGVLGYAVPIGLLTLFVYWVVRRAVRDGMRDAALRGVGLRDAAVDRLPAAAPQDGPEPPREK